MEATERDGGVLSKFGEIGLTMASLAEHQLQSGSLGNAESAHGAGVNKVFPVPCQYADSLSWRPRKTFLALLMFS
jgi:hypothetical protein